MKLFILVMLVRLMRPLKILIYAHASQLWYNPCIICQYIRGKTDENHALFSNSNLVQQQKQSERFVNGKMF